MKKIVAILTLISSILIYSQNSYKEIKTDQLNSGKSQTAKNFIRTFLDKCEDKDYSAFKNYNLSNGFKNFMNEKRKAGRYVPAFYNKI